MWDGWRGKKILQLHAQRIDNFTNSSGQSTGYDKIAARIRVFQQPVQV
jgi:hypothetical protein